MPFFAIVRSMGIARRSVMRATPHTAATATGSAGIASSAAFFGSSSASYLGRSAGSFNPPHAIMARTRSGRSAVPVANAKSAAPAFLFCT